jgi:hypothetical protein
MPYNMINSFRRQIENYILNLPLTIWILMGFLITFILFFIRPVFLDPSLTMQFNKYIPEALTPIGHDFREIAFSSYIWLHTGIVPPTLYPPSVLIFFAPFTFVGYESGYKILIGIILICYLSATLIFPRWLNQSKNTSAFTMFITITGLLSYGLQFELERGQWNLIAFSLSLAAICIFHRQPKYRWLAYLLFSISVQLKLYPAIFVFTLIEDFSDWKNNLKRMAGLGIFNVLALFMFGVNPELSTVHSLDQYSSNLIYINLSITSFTAFFFTKRLLPQKQIILWLIANKWLPQTLLFLLFGFCFLLILFLAYKKHRTGFNPYVFLACFIGACIIPSISFDYKLSMLPASILIAMPEILLFDEDRKRPIVILSAFIFSLAYSSMLYSYIYKPMILENNLPALMTILIICTVLACINPNKPAQSSTNDPPVNSTG